jgi:hypothetical protein
LPDLIELHVLLEAVEHFLRARLDTDHHAPQTRAHGFRKQIVAEPAGLIGAECCGPGDRQVTSQKLFGECVDTLRVREKCLVLEGQVLYHIALMQILDFLADALGRESGPASLEHRRVRAKGTAEAASLRRDVIELPRLLALEIPLNGNQRIVVRRELIEILQRLCEQAADALAVDQPLDDLAERVFALAGDDDVDDGFAETLIGEERRMPSTPDDWTVRLCCFDRTRHGQRIVNRRTGQHRHADTQRTFRRFDHRADRVGFEAAVDDDDVDLGAIERRSDRDQGQRHRVKHRSRVVEDDSRTRVHHEGSPRGFITRVHHEGSSRGFTARVHHEGSPRGFTTRVRDSCIRVNVRAPRL